MIRIGQRRDVDQLRLLYEESVYNEFPKLVEWALNVVPERVLVIETKRQVVGTMYVDTSPAGYKHLWASYLAYKEREAAEKLIDKLIRIRENQGLRNIYVFCPREYVEARVHLITKGFIPECLRKVGGIHHIIESYDGTFTPRLQASPKKKPLPVNLRKGERGDFNALATLLHNSLPIDFPTVKDAANDVERWLIQMPEDIIVALHHGSPVGVLLLSSEIYPVTDRNVGMLCYIAVEERFRGRGVGTALVKEACEVLRRKGKHSMEVDVDANDVYNRIFYTKAGFYPFWFSKSYMPDNDGIFYRTDF
jgi:ribosomal protein S18 acetylase RimI-like enzyme